MKVNALSLDEETFGDVIDESFVTLNSNAQEIELVPSGKDIKVTKANFNDYIKLMVRARINEASVQMKAILDGISSVVSLSLLQIFTWKQIEIRATGSKTLNIQKLKSIS